ncbi:MAG: diguanylate cyclase [Gemmatimonadetes bacterium]|nr:diguanylate cyclase [Gemmatimonadota bacterium]
MPFQSSTRPIPHRALAISVTTLLVPVLGALCFPGQLGEYGAFLWLLLLAPAFVLAYHRGWRGAAVALLGGLVLVGITQAMALRMGATSPESLPEVLTVYVEMVLGVGWMAEALHRERVVVEDMAFTDLLTRLPNRRQARLFLENAFAAAQRGRLLSVVIFDLDRFKGYNDRYGHPAGDEALRKFSEILARTTRRADLSARFGGEEFVSVLTGADAEGAMIFADRIRADLDESSLESGSLTVSGGVAGYHPTIRSPDELLAAADHALYQAKREGRNCIRVYGQAPVDRATAGDGAMPSLESSGPTDYPRRTEDVGRTTPPLKLLPHSITGFGEDRKILLVEDDVQVRSLLTSYLTREGFLVREAADVPGGRAELNQDFDIVVTDLRLPGEPGTELIAAVKSRWPNTQVIAITGVQDLQMAEDAARQGADGYLVKPFGMPNFSATLMVALGRRDGRPIADQEGNVLTEPVTRRPEAVDPERPGADLFAEAAEVRFPSTLGHAQRVAAIAHRLTLEIDPDGRRLDPEAVRLACELKDVGNVSLPLDLLECSRKLTGDERRRLQGHTLEGRRLLDARGGDDTVLEVAAWHHERWDGTGYPDHLKGEAIPLAARIAAVADALAAMTARRPHRPARPWRDALEELRAEAGLQFDPAVVNAAVACAAELALIVDPDSFPPPPSKLRLRPALRS